MAKTIVPTGPSGSLFSGSLPELRRDMLGFLTRCASDYGPIVPLRLGRNRVVFISEPIDIEQVLVTNANNFTKSYIVRLLRPVLGSGLLISEGNFWRRQRRLVQPAFNHDRIASYGEIMVTAANQMLSDWKDGETRDIHEEMMRVTSRIAAKALFGAEITADTNGVAQAVEVVMENFSARRQSLFPMPPFIPTFSNLRLQRAVSRLDKIIYGFINRRRQSSRDHGDLLSMLLRVRDEDDGSSMTDKQLRDEALTLFLAGHETTANVLCWACYLISEHEGIGGRLMAELGSVVGQRLPAAEDLNALHYTERIVLETMRLYPPAYILSRQAVRDFALGSLNFPGGTIVLISQWVTHRNAKYFENPNEFNPDRWKGDLARRLPRCAYFPFGMGPRSCIGASFAMMEAVLLLAMVAQRFQLRVLRDHNIEPWPSITLRPRSGIKVRLSKR